MPGLLSFEPTPIKDVVAIVAELDSTFYSGKTKPIEWRKEQLRQIWRMLDVGLTLDELALHVKQVHETELQDAVILDIGKPRLEVQVFELTMIKNEIHHMLERMEEWLKPTSISVPAPGELWAPTVHKQPKGTILIIGPWNYPVTLVLMPLLGIIAAGNTGIVKPSELCPNTAMRLAELLPRYLDQSAYRLVNGDKDVVTALLEYPFGHICYTGGCVVGKIVMAAAAKNLTPVTLELGGKSPVIISEKAKIDLAAKRIAWGKLANAGQTCVSPDYALVHEDALPHFLDQMIKTIEEFYHGQPEAPGKMGRIINKAHWDRVTSMIKASKGKIILGGGSNAETLFIQPTIVSDLSPDDELLQSEIFGPVLPVLTYKTLTDARQTIRKIGDNPLALYIFTEDQSEVDYILRNTFSGGVAINDVMAQIAVTSVPLGGLGQSGLGAYRGKASIDTFSHSRSVVSVPTDEAFESMLEWRYPSGNAKESFDFFKANLESKLNA